MRGAAKHFRVQEFGGAASSRGQWRGPWPSPTPRGPARPAERRPAAADRRGRGRRGVGAARCTCVSSQLLPRERRAGRTMRATRISANICVHFSSASWSSLSKMGSLPRFSSARRPRLRERGGAQRAPRSPRRARRQTRGRGWGTCASLGARLGGCWLAVCTGARVPVRAENAAKDEADADRRNHNANQGLVLACELRARARRRAHTHAQLVFGGRQGGAWSTGPRGRGNSNSVSGPQPWHAAAGATHARARSACMLRRGALTRLGTGSPSSEPGVTASVPFTNAAA